MVPVEGPLEALRSSVGVPVVSVEPSMEWSADFVAAEPLDVGASFIRMLLLGLSVFGFADPFAFLLQRRPLVLDHQGSLLF